MPRYKPQSPEESRAWEDWAKYNLRSGDIIFRLGDARACFGLLPFSKLSAAMTRSRYSHTGIVSREVGEIFVYDMTPCGARRTPFREYLTDRVVCFSVKRPKRQFQDRTPDAVDYCRRVFQSHVDFDRDFELDDERLYCTELTEKSYRATGLPLCDPVRVGDLKGYVDRPVLAFLLKLFSPFRPDRRLIVAGNEEIGIWSSEDLDLVLGPCSPNDAPPAIARASEQEWIR